MAETAADRLVPLPATGRVFHGHRVVRFGDVSPAGRVRLDALGTYVQDLASDDTADVGVGTDLVWVVRRAVFDVTAGPRFHERLDLATWCSGLGRRWAERRISMVGDRGGRVEAAALWVALDRAATRPVALPADFVATCGPSAEGREVSARLQHASEPPEPGSTARVERRPWPLRATDFDLMGHVNNAAAWALVEEVLVAVDRHQSFRAEIEYRVPVEPGAALEVVVATEPAPSGVTGLWLVGRPAEAGPGADPITFTTARIVRRGS